MGADICIADRGAMNAIVGPTPLQLSVDTMLMLLAVTAEMGASAIRARALVLFADLLGI